jgi:hypothetical protein
MNVLEENPTNYLVRTSDGRAVTKTKSSNLNQLLYGHNLAGLLEEQEEVLQISPEAEEEPTATIIPQGEQKYEMVFSTFPESLVLGAHHKTLLVDALAETFQEYDSETVAPLVKLYEDTRKDMVRENALEAFNSLPGVKARESGWFINGHLLLSWEGEFYHPKTDSRKRSGGVVVPVKSSSEAYNVSVDAAEADMERNVEHEGTTYRLTDSEVEFLAKAMWAIKNTPDQR